MSSAADPAVDPPPNPAVDPPPDPAVNPSPNPVVNPLPNPVVNPSPDPAVNPPGEPAGSPSPDAGLSTQRTGLAWRRTGLSAAAVTLLAVRPAVGGHSGPGRVLACAVVMGCWAAMVAVAIRRSRGLAVRPPQPSRRAMPAYALLTVAIAVIGMLLVLA